MSKRQLEQLRQTLDSIVEDLCVREQAVEEEHSQLQARVAALDTLQAAIAAQLATLTDDLPVKIAAAVAAVIPSASTATAPSSEDAATTELAGELQRVKATLAETEALLVEALDQGSRTTLNNAASDDALHKLAGAEADCVRLSAELAKTRSELSQAASGSYSREQQLDHELVEALRIEVSDLRSLLAAKEHDAVLVGELRDENAALRALTRMEGTDGDMDGAGHDKLLREQLERASCQIIELRTKNEDLTEQVSQLQISTAPHGPMPHLGQEGLSWEERKRLLLQQLDAEQSQEDTPESHAKRIEVQEILRTTEVELSRRDREIAELRSLLEQQSDARQGMAVGAAAVAQLIESDELVLQEREKLRAIQRSWDEKFRQAEIDLSMERAKLARERLHLEEQKQLLEQEAQSANAATQSEPNSKTADARSRKWLSRLGLKEET